MVLIMTVELQTVKFPLASADYIFTHETSQDKVKWKIDILKKNFKAEIEK